MDPATLPERSWRASRSSIVGASGSSWMTRVCRAKAGDRRRRADRVGVFRVADRRRVGSDGGAEQGGNIGGRRSARRWSRPPPPVSTFRSRGTREHVAPRPGCARAVEATSDAHRPPCSPRPAEMLLAKGLWPESCRDPGVSFGSHADRPLPDPQRRRRARRTSARGARRRKNRRRNTRAAPSSSQSSPATCEDPLRGRGRERMALGFVEAERQRRANVEAAQVLASMGSSSRWRTFPILR